MILLLDLAGYKDTAHRPDSSRSGQQLRECPHFFRSRGTASCTSPCSCGPNVGADVAAQYCNPTVLGIPETLRFCALSKLELCQAGRPTSSRKHESAGLAGHRLLQVMFYVVCKEMKSWTVASLPSLCS